jgi:hypothetical protein
MEIKIFRGIGGGAILGFGGYLEWGNIFRVSGSVLFRSCDAGSLTLVIASCQDADALEFVSVS